jgi:hypothetical protein
VKTTHSSLAFAECVRTLIRNCIIWETDLAFERRFSLSNPLEAWCMAFTLLRGDIQSLVLEYLFEINDADERYFLSSLLLSGISGSKPHASGGPFFYLVVDSNRRAS